MQTYYLVAAGDGVERPIRGNHVHGIPGDHGAFDDLSLPGSKFPEHISVGRAQAETLPCSIPTNP